MPPSIPHPAESSDPSSRPSFDEVYADHGARILRLLRRFTENDESARDLLQDVFLKVYQGLPSFQRQSEIGTWIHRIAVNHALNYLKRERRTYWFNILDESIGTLLQKERVELPGWSSQAIPPPDHLLEAKEQAELIEAAVRSLPPNYRVPFLLHRDEEMSNPEIADALGLSLSAVETRIHRARKLLVRSLKPVMLDRS